MPPPPAEGGTTIKRSTPNYAQIIPSSQKSATPATAPLQPYRPRRRYDEYPERVQLALKSQAELAAFIGEMKAKYGSYCTEKSLTGLQANRTNHKTK